MSTERAVLLAGAVGCVAFCAGVIVTLIAWAVVSWLRAAGEQDYEPADIDEATLAAEERIATVHRQAHEMLATTIMQGTADDAELDGLLRASKRGEDGDRTA